MGKYRLTRDLSGCQLSDSQKIEQLNHIANEIAEANRLKRLELKILGGNMDIPNTMAQISEDRA